MEDLYLLPCIGQQKMVLQALINFHIQILIQVHALQI